jgi:hypothetical protein
VYDCIAFPALAAALVSAVRDLVHAVMVRSGDDDLGARHIAFSTTLEITNLRRQIGEARHFQPPMLFRAALALTR